MCFMVSTLGFPPDDLIRRSPPQYTGHFFDIFEPSDGELLILHPENANNQQVENTIDPSDGN